VHRRLEQIDKRSLAAAQARAAASSPGLLLFNGFTNGIGRETRVRF